MNRATSLNRLRAGSEIFDMLIVGGGASGLGAAVDAATRGYRVALIEKADFAKATSSRSTKLVHGGVRYMKQGNLSLVRSALQERGLLLRNAAHLVQAREFVIPCYGAIEKPYYAFGMHLYDLLAGKLSFGASRGLSKAETVGLLPTVETKGLKGGVLYFDGQFDDSRLAIGLAETASERGAALANYCACVGLLKERGLVAGVLARDLQSGAEFEIRSRSVINATGVFVDELRRMDQPAVPPLVVASQGIHLVLPRRFLPGNSALMVPKTADGRVLFAIPWHDRAVFGTTDTPNVPVSLEPRAFPEEVNFILEHAGKYLAEAPAESDVLSVFAGLRPLVRRGSGTKTSALSRDHTIDISESRLITITGGKWTTYRKMAEDLIDHAESTASFVHRSCRTAHLPIHGSLPHSDTASKFGLYGSDAGNISALCQADPSLAKPLHPALPLCRAEVLWHVRHEMALCVEDVLARRSRALLLDARASIEAAPETARLLAAELGRDKAWEEAQVRDYTTLARG